MNLESAEIVRILIVAVVLFAGLGLLKMVFKLTKRVLTIGCLGILVILGALLFFSFVP